MSALRNSCFLKYFMGALLLFTGCMSMSDEEEEAENILSEQNAEETIRAEDTEIIAELPVLDNITMLPDSNFFIYDVAVGSGYTTLLYDISTGEDTVLVEHGLVRSHVNSKDSIDVSPDLTEVVYQASSSKSEVSRIYFSRIQEAPETYHTASINYDEEVNLLGWREDQKGVYFISEKGLHTYKIDKEQEGKILDLNLEGYTGKDKEVNFCYNYILEETVLYLDDTLQHIDLDNKSIEYGIEVGLKGVYRMQASPNMNYVLLQEEAEDGVSEFYRGRNVPLHVVEIENGTVREIHDNIVDFSWNYKNELAVLVDNEEEAKLVIYDSGLQKENQLTYLKSKDEDVLEVVWLDEESPGILVAGEEDGYNLIKLK